MTTALRCIPSIKMQATVFNVSSPMDYSFPPIRRGQHRLEDTAPRNPTTKTSHHSRRRSHSMSPGMPTSNSRAYPPVSASHTNTPGNHIPVPFWRPVGAFSTAAMSGPPTKYTSPFISTKSRPSLYQRAVSNSNHGSNGRQGGSRSRSGAAPTPAVAATARSTHHSAVYTPSFVHAMVPPATSLFITKPQPQADRGENYYKKDFDAHSRCSSRGSASNSNTSSSGVHGKGKYFVAKLKSLVKGDGHGTDNMSMIYLTPEEIRERDIKFKKAAVHVHAI